MDSSQAADAARDACFQILDTLLPTQTALSSAANRPYTAVLVEPDQSRATNFVLNNLMESLDTRWGFLFFHGAEHAAWAAEQVPSQLRSQITLRPIPADRPLAHFLASQEFLDQIPTETFLLIKTDSMINPRYAKKLYMFLDYDYVGAPWTWDHLQVGNGHLSLRKKSAMLRILKELGPFQGDYEDQYFSYGCKKTGAKVPSREVAREFSVSEIFHAASFGFHKPWGHLPTRFRDLCRICPELEELQKLQADK